MVVLRQVESRAMEIGRRRAAHPVIMFLQSLSVAAGQLPQRRSHAWGIFQAACIHSVPAVLAAQGRIGSRKVSKHEIIG
jgi:hypothetical protein